MSAQPRQRKTIIYARATDHAEAARQLEVCQAYALRAGYYAGTIDQVSDFQTGAGIQSLILQGVRERIRSGNVDALIAESPGLITSDPDELVEIDNECRAYGTELRFPTQGY